MPLGVDTKTLDYIQHFRFVEEAYAGFRGSHHRCSIKNVFLKISHNSQKNTCVRVLIKARACNFFEKETLTAPFYRTRATESMALMSFIILLKYVKIKIPALV